jgi:predicted Fe-Mo cluster-binding NifX family protein
MMYMRISIPVDEQSLNSEVCRSLGRAPHLLFFNTVTKEQYFLDNRAVASKGAAGTRVAQVIADHGVNALLTLRCGKNTEEVLHKAEVLVYKALPGTAKENLVAFMEEKLSLLDEFHDGLHGKESL